MNKHAKHLQSLREGRDKVSAFREAVNYIASITGDDKTAQLLSIMLYDFKTAIEDNAYEHLQGRTFNPEPEIAPNASVPNESEVSASQDAEQDVPLEEVEGKRQAVG